MSGAYHPYSKVNKERQARAQVKKQDFLTILKKDPTRPIAEILGEMGFTVSAYNKWRVKDQKFASDVTTLRARAGVTVNHKVADQVRERFQGTFIQWREHYLGLTTPWFQERTIDAYRRAKGGDIVLTLYPPEHGKTATTEDDLTHAICEDKSIQITTISEGQGMARKISRRVQSRLEENGPFPELVFDYGPFQPQNAEGGARQPWGVDAWSVYGKSDFDDRDYSFATGGWRSQIAGTRADRLHLDDLQSLRSLNQTNQMIDTVRQDFFTRPGETGIITGNGTRVGEKDIYEWFKREFGGEDFFQLIEFPAIIIDHIDGEAKPLWERDEDLGIGYTMEMLERLRKKVGEEAWWRNYMQKPRTSSLTVFSDDGVEKSRNHQRSMNHRRDQIDEVQNDECWLTLDPSIGGVNVTAAVHPGDKLMLLDMQKDVDLPRNSAIAEKIETVARRVAGRGWRPTRLIIEAMAFQKGLVEDEFIVDVCRQFGMAIESHLTGLNKYDENIGIPSMASSFEAGSVDLPYQSNFDRALTDDLLAECQAWKPTRDSATGKLKFKRGNQSVQDQMMALWFGWVWWTNLRSVRNEPEVESDSFTMNGLPFAPMGAGGLLVPR